MKKILIFVFILCGLAFLSAPVLSEVSFVDASGDTVALSCAPENTAVLFSSFAEVWNLSGGETRITVYEAVERGFAGEDAVLVDMGAGKSIDLEMLIEARPDFVITSIDIPAQRKAAEFLKSAGIPTAEMRVESIEDYVNMLKVFTDITGNAEAYRVYGEEVYEKAEDIRLKANENKGETPKILFIRSGSSVTSAKAKNAKQHFAAKMLEELGAYNIADNAKVLLDGLSFEEILIEDPDYIFISTMGDEEKAIEYMESVLSESTWQALSCIKNRDYMYLPKDLFQYKPNHRWAEAYEIMYNALYFEDDEA
ncbi:MAG: ABC transporter substrate-binding protein [Clostridia bacterium]|nr:ABC transporter substrate-binding protein [Clostridia bacterium]